MGRTLVANPLCLALDSNDRSSIHALAESTHAHVGMFKLGLTAIYAVGIDVVADVGSRRPVFLDAKLHDIPAQVAGAVEGIGELGASFVTVHASGGPDMVRAATDAAAGRIGVLAVTVLTSLDAATLRAIGMEGSPREAAIRLAEMAVEAGADGIVCSAHEVAAIRARFEPTGERRPLLVVPGIRPAGSDPGDQRRTTTPRAAVDAGADVIVVGRPITSAPDPAGAARAILAEIGRDEP